jgi:uncharacterized protein YjbI with pentapeptide repeats
MENVEFLSAVGRRGIFHGSQLKKCTFAECKYIEAQMEGIELSNVNIMRSSFIKANLMNSKINDSSSFVNVDFSCTRFDSSENHSIIFKDCKFHGIRLDNAVIKNSSLYNVSFKKIREYTNFIYSSCKLREIEFLVECEGFRNYLNM